MEFDIIVHRQHFSQGRIPRDKPPIISRDHGIRNNNSEFSNSEQRAIREYFSDLQIFVCSRLGPDANLPIPQLNIQCENRAELVDTLTKDGYYSIDWLSNRLSEEEVDEAVKSISMIHAAGLAYRMSLKTDVQTKYPWIKEDIYTSNRTKILLARYLDSYLYYLSSLHCCEDVVFTLHRYKNAIFQLLLSLRKPSDSLGNRFRTVCHGDLWMGNLFFRKDAKGKMSCQILDFHSSGYSSPACDLAHLLLTSTPSNYIIANWDHIVDNYYESFSFHLAKLGLVLKHLGTNKNQFKQEMRRALAGEMLCLGVVTPILALCGHKQISRSRASSIRENTVHQLIQMMCIQEEGEENGVSQEWQPLTRDPRLRESIIEILTTCRNLGVLEELNKHVDPLEFKRTLRRTRTL